MATKILSYNILAQRYIQEDNYEYIENKTILIWPYRLNLIRSKIKDSNPDIFCLQEVELKFIEEDFIGFFAEYESLAHIINKKRKNEIGNAIFWKRGLFQKNNSISCCYGLFVNLFSVSTQTDFWLGNIHLKAGRTSCINERVFQMKSCVKKIPKNSYGIVCGDFNDSLCINSKLRSFIEENGYHVYSAGLSWAGIRHGDSWESQTFDNIITIGKVKIDVDYNFSEQLTCLPNEDEASDHLAISFSIYFNFINSVS